MVTLLGQTYRTDVLGTYELAPDHAILALSTNQFYAD